MSPFRFLSRVALLAATAACAAAQRTAVGGPTAGCYSLMVADWDRTVAAATGLPGLPNYVALDPAASGPRGHRLTVPAAWQSVGPNPEWASWRNENGGLILTFLGPRGTLEIALRPTPDGLAGDGITPLQGGVTPVRVMMATSSCVGLRGGAA